jgi:hypothetical protein
MTPSKPRWMAQARDSKEALLELGLLEGDEEGCVETLVGLLEVDEEGCAETLGGTELADGELVGPAEGSDEGRGKGPLTSRTRLARR